MPNSSQTSVEITNSMGVLVYKSSHSSHLINVNLTHCSYGLYTIKLKFSNQQIVKKVIINRQ